MDRKYSDGLMERIHERVLAGSLVTHACETPAIRQAYLRWRRRMERSGRGDGREFAQAARAAARNLPEPLEVPGGPLTREEISEATARAFRICMARACESENPNWMKRAFEFLERLDPMLTRSNAGSTPEAYREVWNEILGRMETSPDAEFGRN